jgi:hypothetical protein
MVVTTLECLMTASGWMSEEAKSVLDLVAASPALLLPKSTAEVT